MATSADFLVATDMEREEGGDAVAAEVAGWFGIGGDVFVESVERLTALDTDRHPSA